MKEVGAIMEEGSLKERLATDIQYPYNLYTIGIHQLYEFV